MEYSTWAFLLLAVAVCLLIAEVFIPTGGIISILATLSILGAVYSAWQAWWSSSPGSFWAFIGGMMMVLPATIVVAFYFWPSTPMGKRAILPEPQPHEVASFVEQEEKYRGMVGKVGETATSLNPAGIANIDGQRVHCQSEGMILDAGTQVVVISARGNRVVVRKVDAQASISPPRPTLHQAPETDSPLDFDLS
ncbi:MAG: NfeD family protein [Planctomycetes bacterium]|nr:NfeD family protein [Planctomycetota bacterium]